MEDHCQWPSLAVIFLHKSRGQSSVVTCSHKTSAVRSQRLKGSPGATRTQTAKGSGCELRAFLLLRHEQRRGLSPGRRRARHVPASAPFHQCKSLPIARRLLNNLKEAWGRGLCMLCQQSGGNSGGATCACVCSCITYAPHGTNHVAYLHIYVSGFDRQQRRRSNSFVSLSWALRCSDVGGVCGSSLHFCAWHSLQRGSEFMDVLSHLIVTLMEAEAGNASP